MSAPIASRSRCPPSRLAFGELLHPSRQFATTVAEIGDHARLKQRRSRFHIAWALTCRDRNSARSGRDGKAACPSLAQTWARAGPWNRHCARLCDACRIGSERRFDYSAIGSVTNLASRLCDEAKSGQINVEARVFNAVEGLAAEGLFEARALQPMSLKGFRWPVEAYEIVGRRQALPKGP